MTVQPEILKDAMVDRILCHSSGGAVANTPRANPPAGSPGGRHKLDFSPFSWLAKGRKCNSLWPPLDIWMAEKV